jgi:hypothetical protein
MPQFTVDEDLAALVEKLAKPKPFENLSFNAALRRVLQAHIEVAKPAPRDEELAQLLAEALAEASARAKKAPSPNPVDWVASVPELKSQNLTTWKAVCDVLKIDTAGDSARRKLRNWVKSNRPSWPAVPDVD